jgi:hypothetical protein
VTIVIASGKVTFSDGVSADGVGAAAYAAVNGRLTLASGSPVPLADVTAATIVYLTPFRGQKIGLHNGTTWETLTFVETALSLAGLTAGKPYDIFGYNSSGALTLEALVWVNDNTRTTALALQDGILVKSGAPTRRYLGTIYTTNTGQCEDSLAKRYVWNYYNRLPRKMQFASLSVSWTVVSSTIRQAQASIINQLNCVVGVSEDAIAASIVTYGQSNVGVSNAAIAQGLNTRTAFSGSSTTCGLQSTAISPMVNENVHMPTAGVNYIAWLEQGDGTNVATFTRGYMQGVVMA